MEKNIYKVSFTVLDQVKGYNYTCIVEAIATNEIDAISQASIDVLKHIDNTSSRSFKSISFFSTLNKHIEQLNRYKYD